MKLYGYWRSSATWRVRLALNLKRLAYDYVPVHLSRAGGEQRLPAHLARNPLGQVPVLEVTASGRPMYLAQSLAIIEYLEESYPEIPLLPSSKWERAKARQIAEMINSGIQPLQNISVSHYVRDELQGDPARWNLYWVARGLQAVEQEISALRTRFAVSDFPTIADVCLIPQIYNARRFGVDLLPYPTCRRIEAALSSWPEAKAAHPGSQPDAGT